MPDEYVTVHPIGDESPTRVPTAASAEFASRADAFFSALPAFVTYQRIDDPHPRIPRAPRAPISAVAEVKMCLYCLSYTMACGGNCPNCGAPAP